jgi:hypothetical protein
MKTKLDSIILITIWILLSTGRKKLLTRISRKISDDVYSFKIHWLVLYENQDVLLV